MEEDNNRPKSFLLMKGKKSTTATIVEIFVAIVVITLLVFIVFKSIRSTQAKARDLDRISDIREIEFALELYYLDEGSYPTRNEAFPENSNESELVSKGYLNKLPKDPRGGDYYYVALVNPKQGTECDGYHLGALFERDNRSLINDADFDSTSRDVIPIACEGGLRFDGSHKMIYDVKLP